MTGVASAADLPFRRQRIVERVPRPRPTTYIHIRLHTDTHMVERGPRLRLTRDSVVRRHKRRRDGVGARWKIGVYLKIIHGS